MSKDTDRFILLEMDYFTNQSQWSHLHPNPSHVPPADNTQHSGQNHHHQQSTIDPTPTYSYGDFTGERVVVNLQCISFNIQHLRQFPTQHNPASSGLRQRYPTILTSTRTSIYL